MEQNKIIKQQKQQQQRKRAACSVRLATIPTYRFFLSRFFLFLYVSSTRWCMRLRIVCTHFVILPFYSLIHSMRPVVHRSCVFQFCLPATISEVYLSDAFSSLCSRTIDCMMCARCTSVGEISFVHLTLLCVKRVSA